MQCPSCGAVMPAEDRFCEECGSAMLAAPVQSSGCPKCGASADEVDEQGYCSGCGHLRVPRERDRIEIEIASHFAGVSDRGVRHHRNEDFLVIDQGALDGSGILVVCDGVSSSQEPDRASEAAAAEISRALLAGVSRGADPEDCLRDAFAAALKAVRALPRMSGRDQDPPSTTAVAAIVRNGEVIVGWRGDSRAYWLNGAASRQLTSDHSWMNEVVSRGEMSEEEALRSDKAHAITRWLGADCDDDGEPSLIRFAIPGPGRLLLCSDGLWNYAPSAEMLSQLSEGAQQSALAAARLFVEFANGQGGRDNITAAIYEPRS